MKRVEVYCQRKSDGRMLWFSTDQGHSVEWCREAVRILRDRGHLLSVWVDDVLWVSADSGPWHKYEL